MGRQIREQTTTRQRDKVHETNVHLAGCSGAGRVSEGPCLKDEHGRRKPGEEAGMLQGDPEGREDRR